MPLTGATIVAYWRLSSACSSSAAACCTFACAEATRDFNRAVDRTHSRDALQPAFDRLAERYHHVRQQVENRESPYSDSTLAFERVTEAYLDVDRALNHPESSYRN